MSEPQPTAAPSLELQFRQSAVAKVVWDRELRVLHWNPAAEKLFGYTESEALGQHWSFVAPPAAWGALEIVGHEILGGAASVRTSDNVRKDGAGIVCDWHDAPLRSDAGAVVGVSSEIIDVTARARLHSALVQGQRMEAFGKLAGGIAHDFGNILGVILSFGSFAMESIPQGARGREDMNEVLKAARRAVDLTRQLLAFSRQQPTRRVPIDLNVRLAELHKLLLRTLGEHIALDIVPNPRPTIVELDPVQFDQVVLNLAINARDAMVHGGQLRILLEQSSADAESEEPKLARLRVIDTGAGIDEATQARIFEPFFTTKPAGKGTGLGLATCFGIAAQAGGRITVESIVGSGSTFTLELPLSRAALQSEVDRGEPPKAVQSSLVLLVEDEEPLRRIGGRVLKNAGYRVAVAKDGPEALTKIEELKAQIDLVVSDVVLPGCSGFDVAKFASKWCPSAGIVLTSGYYDANVHALDSVYPMLWKPVAPADLLRAVASALEARSKSGKEPERASSRERTVIVVDADAPFVSGVTRVLGEAGYVVKEAGSVREGTELLASGVRPRAVLCELSLPDGPGTDLLEWIEAIAPEIVARTFVMTSATVAPRAQELLDSGRFRLLAKPLEPARLLAAVDEGRIEPTALMTTDSVGKLRIEVESGSTLPIDALDETPLPSHGPESLPVVRAPKTDQVLLVDDEASLAQALRRALVARGMDCTVCENLARARQALDAKTWDALVLDVDLPDGSGLDLLAELRGRHCDLPVVVMSGAPTVARVTAALRCRVNEFLSKPLGGVDLVRAVDAAISSGRIARARNKLIAARLGGELFPADAPETRRLVESARARLEVVYQPIVRAKDSSVYGFEAFLRTGETALASPPKLLAAAEAVGQLHEICVAVRASVAETMHAHRDTLDTIFLNVHPAEFQSDILAAEGDPLLPIARRVVLEITERASLDSGSSLDATLSCLRAHGYRVAIDDLGEGYAGLATLARIKPEFAKIDVSLVRDIDRLPLTQDIVAAIIDLSRRSGITVIAEGVETNEERRMLISLGCDLLQGFLFAKPGPPFPIARASFGWENKGRSHAAG